LRFALLPVTARRRWQTRARGAHQTALRPESEGVHWRWRVSARRSASSVRAGVSARFCCALLACALPRGSNDVLAQQRRLEIRHNQARRHRERRRTLNDDSDAALRLVPRSVSWATRMSIGAVRRKTLACVRAVARRVRKTPYGC